MKQFLTRHAAVAVVSLGAFILTASGEPKPVPSPRAATRTAAVPTFTRDVAPILFANCASCHHPEEIGPFALLTYPDAATRAKEIAEVVGTHSMPPWKPIAGHGLFRDARTLTDAQVATLTAWANAGAPEGNLSDMPPAPKFTGGWHLGPPDTVLTIAKPFAIPATGKDIYVHFVFPNTYAKDKYLRAVQILPSNRRVAHHAVIILDGSGEARQRAAGNGGDHYESFGGPGFIPRGFLPGYAPGLMTRSSPDGESLVLTRGFDIVLQMHYHPTGKLETDQPQIGLYFTEKPPKRRPVIFLMGTEDIDVPAGEAAYTRSDSFTIPADFEIRTVFAHMHLIGRGVHVWFQLPGKKTPHELLKIDDWDFNWQDTYSYARPFVLPKGTVVHSDFVWDNSDGNRRNPHTPPKRMTLGENSTDEMAGLVIGGRTVDPDAEPAWWLHVVGHYFEIRKSGDAVREAHLKPE